MTTSSLNWTLKQSNNQHMNHSIDVVLLNLLSIFSQQDAIFLIGSFSQIFFKSEETHMEYFTVVA